MAAQIFHKLEDKGNPNRAETKKALTAGIFVLIAVAGLFSGWLAARLIVPRETSSVKTYTGEETGVFGAKKLGQKNDELCPDTAEGTVKKGGIDGEGTHHLQRPGGESQNVYLTSSTIDLDQVVNKKVKVWGQTYAAETAGWLMDACYLEVK